MRYRSGVNIPALRIVANSGSAECRFELQGRTSTMLLWFLR